MLGDAVEITEGYRTWWSYIPHFIATPGYVYAYAYGQLLALSVYAQYEARGRRLRPAVPGSPARRRIDAARRAGQASSTSTSPTPDSGTAASTSSNAASKRRSRPPRPREGCHDVSRHPVEHRQRRDRGAALHHPHIPSSSWSGVWVHSPAKVGQAMRGSCAGSRRRACSRPTMSTRCSRSTPTASPTPPPPTCARWRPINDMARILRSGKNVVSSSVVAAL